MVRFTALNRIAEFCNMSLNSAERARNNFKLTEKQFDKNAENYANGEAAAYNVSYKIMKKELEQLRLKFQNNCLTLDDFNTDDYDAAR